MIGELLASKAPGVLTCVKECVMTKEQFSSLVEVVNELISLRDRIGYIQSELESELEELDEDDEAGASLQGQIDYLDMATGNIDECCSNIESTKPEA